MQSMDSISENIDDNLKAVEHPPKPDNLPAPINENDKHAEADKINSSTDNSSTDEEKNENDNHLENGHVDPDVHNHNGGDYVERGSSQGSNRFTVEGKFL
uniref:Uncharacterized protein n=1 Tax=Panagrolaimus davidi TaxID=227884 RepID=A0A914NXV1_9BILA